MTIVRRQRSDRFAVVPNHVWEEQTRLVDGQVVALSFMAKALLAYLLGRPHNWIVKVDHLQGVMGCGRNKAYELIAELVAFGYARRDGGRDQAGRLAPTTLVIYDEPVALAVAPPHPEIRDVVPPHPGSRYPADRDLYKEQKETNSPQPPLAGGRGFAELWEEWPDDHRGQRGNAEGAFARLPADDQASALNGAALCLKALRLRKARIPALAAYLRKRMFLEFDGAPDVNLDGRFVVRPGAAEWNAWLGDIRMRYGQSGVDQTVMRGFFLPATRWPEGHDTRGNRSRSEQLPGQPPKRR